MKVKKIKISDILEIDEKAFTIRLFDFDKKKIISFDRLKK